MNDIAIGNFFQKLEYKAANADKELIKVQPHLTSQDCSSCGNRVKKDLSVRVHHCLQCGLKICRDWNAAKNILRLGQSLKDVTYSVG